MTILFNTATHTTDGAGSGPLVSVFYRGDHMISANAAGDIDGGTLTIKIFNRDGVEIDAPADLVYTTLPQGEIISLPKDFKVQAVLAGAAAPDFELEINQV